VVSWCCAYLFCTVLLVFPQAAEKLRYEVRAATSKAAALEGELSAARKAAEAAAEAQASAERAAAQVGGDLTRGAWYTALWQW
jgi:hypothetical protein